MSFGTLHTIEGSARSHAILMIAKANGLDIKVNNVEQLGEQAPTEYRLHNKLGKVPTFVGADGFVLTECIAIAIYVTSQNEKTTLLGKTKQDYASILKWMSFANSDLNNQLLSWVLPLIGRRPYNKKTIDDATKGTNDCIKVLDDYLLVNTFLVGERLTLADIFVTTLLVTGFKTVFDKSWRNTYSNVLRWFETVRNQPIWQGISLDINYLEEAVKYTPPKKEEKPKKEQPKSQPKTPAAKAVAAEEEEEEPQAPKPKHPLDLLPRATFVMDDWKRKYSNEDTPIAMKWFWVEANFDEYSLWRVDYKYNDELTQTFMSSNLIGGFFNRLEGSRKHIFGSSSVFGTANNSIIRGAFFIRGHEHEPAFEVAPDWESYSFVKLDPKKPEDREFIESMWSWDRPITENGQEYPHADGKVFK